MSYLSKRGSSQFCHFGFSSFILSCLVYSPKFINNKNWERVTSYMQNVSLSMVCQWCSWLCLLCFWCFFFLVMALQCCSGCCFWFKIVCYTEASISYLRHSVSFLITNFISKLLLALCTFRCVRPAHIN